MHTCTTKLSLCHAELMFVKLKTDPTEKQDWNIPVHAHCGKAQGFSTCYSFMVSSVVKVSVPCNLGCPSQKPMFTHNHNFYIYGVAQASAHGTPVLRRDLCIATSKPVSWFLSITYYHQLRAAASYPSPSIFTNQFTLYTIHRSILHTLFSVMPIPSTQHLPINS